MTDKQRILIVDKPDEGVFVCKIFNFVQIPGDQDFNDWQKKDIDIQIMKFIVQLWKTKSSLQEHVNIDRLFKDKCMRKALDKFDENEDNEDSFLRIELKEQFDTQNFDLIKWIHLIELREFVSEINDRHKEALSEQIYNNTRFSNWVVSELVNATPDILRFPDEDDNNL